MEEDIPRFNIAMNNTQFMRIIKGLGYLLNQWQRLIEGQGATGIDNLAQGTPGDIRHNQICLLILFSIFIDRNNIDMIKRGNSISFTTKTRQKISPRFIIQRRTRQEHLYCYRAAR